MQIHWVPRWKCGICFPFNLEIIKCLNFKATKKNGIKKFWNICMLSMYSRTTRLHCISYTFTSCIEAVSGLRCLFIAGLGRSSSPKKHDQDGLPSWKPSTAGIEPVRNLRSFVSQSILNHPFTLILVICTVYKEMPHTFALFADCKYHSFSLPGINMWIAVGLVIEVRVLPPFN